MLRNITVYVSRGQKTKVIETDATTFAELKEVLKANDVAFNIRGQVAVESVNNTTLELDNAVLPDSNFTLAIFQRKTKAGADRTTLYNRIKEFIARDGKDAVNSYFKEVAGKHYTNISTDALEGFVDSYGSAVIASTEVPNKASVLALLKELGVSSELIEEVSDELCQEKIEVNHEWISWVCANHPLVTC